VIFVIAVGFTLKAGRPGHSWPGSTFRGESTEGTLGR